VAARERAAAKDRGEGGGAAQGTILPSKIRSAPPNAAVQSMLLM
jgi:hypothetical protein